VNLRTLAIGTVMLALAGVIRIGLQFLILPILARLLSPVEYGLVATCMPFIVFAQIFSDGGVGQSILRSKDAHPGELSSLFWLITLFGGVAAVVIVLISGPVATFYAEPKLRDILCVLSLVCIIQAATVVPAASLQRAERYSLMATADVVAAISGVSTAILLAFSGAGAWAIVAQQLVSWTMRSLVIWFASSFRPAFVFQRQLTEAHWPTSRDIIVFNVINFFARSLDPLVLARTFSAAIVGSYAFAYQIMRLPSMVVTGPIQSVFYTRIAARPSDLPYVKRMLLTASSIVSIFVFPAMLAIAAGHQQVFRLLLSPKWGLSATIFACLAVVGAFQAITGLNGAVLIATGNSKRQIKFTTEFTIIWVIGLLASALFSAQAVAISYSVLWFLYFPRFARSFLSAIECSVTEYLRVMAQPLIVALAGAAVIWMVGRQGLSDVLFLATLALIVAIEISILAILNVKSLLRTIRELNAVA
jgi:polysaccharide transporter, PST family